MVAVAGIGSLGYRFYKTMKQRNADRETEEAARAAARVRVRLDDDDDDGYGDVASHDVFASQGMVQLHNEPPIIMGGFDPHSGGLGIMGFDEEPPVENGGHYLENGAPYLAPVHEPTIQREPLHLQTAFEDSDIGESGYSAHSMRSGESEDHLLLTRASTTSGNRMDTSPSSKRNGPTRSNTTTLSVRSDSRSTMISRHPPTRSATQSSGSSSRAPHGQARPLSGSFTSSHTPSSTISRSHSSHLLERPPLPILPLPEAFGEGEAERPATPQSHALGDEEDYHGTIGRVLKIANE